MGPTGGAPDIAARAQRMAEVGERLAEVRERVAQVGDPGAVTVVAVTKGFGPEAVEAAAGCGLNDLGENYAQELLAKAPHAPATVRWHFLGQLQRNKLAKLAPRVHLWQGLDSEAGAEALASCRPAAPVLVQVKVAGGPGRHGADARDVPTLVERASAAGLEVRGLMAVGPLGGAAAGARECFRAVAGLARRLGLAELSMGMSADYEIAVSEGATMIRLGRALFGPRPTVPGPGAEHSQATLVTRRI
jgi:PLP dependent protein